MHDYLIQLDFFEYFIWIVYLLITLSFLYVYKEFNKSAYTKYLYPSLLIKTFGALAFALVYIFYYTEGDCNYYYYGNRELLNIFYTEPSKYFELLFLNGEEAKEYLDQNALLVLLSLMKKVGF
jgi:hypothetical protein